MALYISIFDKILQVVYARGSNRVTLCGIVVLKKKERADLAYTKYGGLSKTLSRQENLDRLLRHRRHVPF